MRFVSGEIARLYLDMARRLQRGVESGVITEDQYRDRMRAVSDWLRERDAYVLPDRDCGYILIRTANG